MDTGQTQTVNFVTGIDYVAHQENAKSQSDKLSQISYFQMSDTIDRHPTNTDTVTCALEAEQISSRDCLVAKYQHVFRVKPG